MFTGLIQSIGKVHLHGKGMFVECEDLISSITLGDSISVDGVCLTVAALRNNGFIADVSEETLERSTLSRKARDISFVNLEPALRLSDRLGGHLVSGHVDGLGKVVSIEKLKNSWDLEIAWEQNQFAKYICDKASISVNGISLTVANSKKEGVVFSIAVIPHTWESTSLKYLSLGELVNLEADLMAKYAEQLLIKTTAHDPLENNSSKDLSKEWLANHGWI